MASEVEICNLALGHLGDSATVASIDPPEGSSQAEHCARFYPIARDSLLELVDWPFATSRALLAQQVNIWPRWRYAYAFPADALRILAVVDPAACDDTTAAQQFAIEADANGDMVIYTHQLDAVVRYTRKTTNTSKFSPLFVDTLARFLASYLAGPILKGDSGIAESKAQLAIAMAMLARAATSSANQQHQTIPHIAPWLAGR